MMPAPMTMTSRGCSQANPQQKGSSGLRSRRLSPPHTQLLQRMVGIIFAMVVVVSRKTGYH